MPTCGLPESEVAGLGPMAEPKFPEVPGSSGCSTAPLVAKALCGEVGVAEVGGRRGPAEGWEAPDPEVLVAGLRPPRGGVWGPCGLELAPCAAGGRGSLLCSLGAR